MVDSTRLLTPLEEDALAITKAAIDMSMAKEEKDEASMITALDSNLKLWVGIRTLVKRNDSQFPMETRNNLLRLSDFVAQKTFELGRELNFDTVEALINTNLQIAEGLLESLEKVE